jgi:hypothetical protein
MMTNVDFEGFNDWSDKELKEAIDAINHILLNRHTQKIKEAINDLEKAFLKLQAESNDVSYICFNGDYSLESIFATIKTEYKMKGLI